MVDVDGQPAATATLSSTTLSTPSTPTESSEQWRPPTLAELSRNASVISSSSESELASPVDPPSRPKPLRLGPNASTSTSTTNSSTNTTRPVSPSSHNQHPNGPPTPRAARPPVHLGFHNTNEDGGGPSTQPNSPQRSRAPSRQRAQGRSASQNGRGVGVSYADFAFGDILGEGSYSTVRGVVPVLV
jgi:3-phosphoinositide dependent protein kinase-1